VDESEELRAIQGGDAEVFADWMARVEDGLRGALSRFAASVDVEAVLQEALLRAWQVAPNVVDDGRPAVLLRLTHRIARNLAISETRRLRKVAVDDDALERWASAEAPRAEAPDVWLRAHVTACREELPPKPRAAFDARLEVEGGEADATLAERLGMTLNTFLQNFTRARKMLVACLDGRGVDVAEELR
jgi:DNA-directed RNA polymerase specialized sigma24 family protein